MAVCSTEQRTSTHTHDQLRAYSKRRSTKIGITTGMRAFWFVTCLALVLCSLYWADYPLILFAERVQPQGGYLFFKYASKLGGGTIWFVVAAFLIGVPTLLIWNRSFEQMQTAVKVRMVGIYLAVTLALSGIVVQVMKYSIGRYRPKHYLADRVDGLAPFTFFGGYDSFPSGHSQTIWAAMIALSVVFPRGKFVFIPIAVLVSMSRIVLLRHYLSDVLFGSLLGISIALLVKHMLENRWGYRLRWDRFSWNLFS